jgi:hypothetical protein
LAGGVTDPDSGAPRVGRREEILFFLPFFSLAEIHKPRLDGRKRSSEVFLVFFCGCSDELVIDDLGWWWLGYFVVRFGALMCG